MTEHKYAEILRAIADGKAVQFKSSHTDWTDLNVKYLFFNAQCFEYRVKPKPKVKKWRWVFKDGNTGAMAVSGSHYVSEKEFNSRNTTLIAVQPINSTMIEEE